MESVAHRCIAVRRCILRCTIGPNPPVSTQLSPLGSPQVIERKGRRLSDLKIGANSLARVCSPGLHSARRPFVRQRLVGRFGQIASGALGSAPAMP
jgi:hypothetical protein